MQIDGTAEQRDDPPDEAGAARAEAARTGRAEHLAQILCTRPLVVNNTVVHFWKLLHE